MTFLFSALSFFPVYLASFSSSRSYPGKCHEGGGICRSRAIRSDLYPKKWSPQRGKFITGSDKGSPIRIVARTYTRTVIHLINGKRRGTIPQFLKEVDLINRNNPIILMAGADFHEADLECSNLSNLNLSKVNIGGATLDEANLTKTNLGGANLIKAFIRNASLKEIQLSRANLTKAVLKASKEADCYAPFLEIQTAFLPATGNVRQE